MKNILLLVMMPVIIANSQTVPDSTTSVWKHSLITTATISQVSYSDWAQGGENALSYSLRIEGKSVQNLTNTIWSNTYKIAYGQSRLSSKGLRKTDDRIELESVLSYKVGTHINPYASLTFKSQFDDGFKYNDAKNTKTQTSSSFDPMYLTQTVGAGYQPIAEVKMRLGAGMREVFDKNKFGYADDVKTPGTIESSKIEGGFESVTEVEIKLEQNTLFKSKIELFAPFKHLDMIILRSDNIISTKVNSFISVVMNLQIINDVTVSPRSQIKESLALGFSYTFL